MNESARSPDGSDVELPMATLGSHFVSAQKWLLEIALRSPCIFMISTTLVFGTEALAHLGADQAVPVEPLLPCCVVAGAGVGAPGGRGVVGRGIGGVASSLESPLIRPKLHKSATWPHISPGLFALGPVKFSQRGVTMTRLMLYIR